MDKWRGRERESKKRTRDVAGVVLTLGLSLMSAFLLSKALWAAICLIPTFAFGFDLLGTFIPSSQQFRRSMILGEIALAIACVYGLWRLVLRDQYRTQRAAETEGDLEPVGDNKSSGDVAIQIGQTGPILQSSNGFQGISPMFQFAYDAGLRVARIGGGGLEITTPVRDRAGNLVAEIESNHWKVYPPYCADKNYDKHRLEVKDGGGHVVLQITLLADRVQLQGEWRNQFGRGVRFSEINGRAAYTLWSNPQQEQQYEALIPAMFRYPSSGHWEELLAKQP
jgi:hypothetical protein